MLWLIPFEKREYKDRNRWKSDVEQVSRNKKSLPDRKHLPFHPPPTLIKNQIKNQINFRVHRKRNKSSSSDWFVTTIRLSFAFDKFKFFPVKLLL